MTKTPRSSTKAIFLDRDGVLNKEVDNLRSVRQLRILPGVPKALRELKRMGYLLIVITNQPVIARGWITPKDLDGFHVNPPFSGLVNKY